MRATNVPIKEDLLIQLHQIGKANDIPLATLVDQLIREGLQFRKDREEIVGGGGSAECPF